MAQDIGSPASPGLSPGAIRLRAALSFVAVLVIFGALLFAPAGRWDWLAAWLYVGLVSLTSGANLLYLGRTNPVLIERRMQLGSGTKTWDIVWACLFGPVMIAIYVVAGVDAGRDAGLALSVWTWLAGLVLHVSGVVLLAWSMGVNPFFEKTVRIQKEYGHRVIDTGPYAFVRHPGYVGFLGWILSVPLLLGSWWAFVPASLAVAGLVVRTALEDRTLRNELDGYVGYAERVRYRLVPGLW